MTRRSWRHQLSTVSVVVLLGTGAFAATAAPANATAPAAVERTATPHTTAPSALGAQDVGYETWQRDVKAVIDQALPYVERRTANASDEKLAIVFDVDNTTLETDFHSFFQYPTPAVRPSLELARYAESRGVDVFFVTARPGIIHWLTEDNLERVGYPVEGLYARSLPDLFDEVSRYKTSKRAEIEAKGYAIIANVGNRSTDMVGGHAERTFKLPDYDGQLS